MLREIRNIKQTDIAERLGISQNAYSRLEQNQTKLSIEQAEKLAEIFGVSLTDLISKDNPIISFIYNDSVSVKSSGYYINNNYNGDSPEVIEAIMVSKDKEIEALKEQNKIQQEQINQFIALLGDYLKDIRQKA